MILPAKPVRLSGAASEEGSIRDSRSFPYISLYEHPLQVCDTGRVRHAFRFTFQLEIRREDGKFVWLPFRLDTGTDLHDDPPVDGEKFKIPFASNFPTRPNTGMGCASEDFYFGRACYSFPELSDWQFEVDCSFSRTPTSRIVSSASTTLSPLHRFVGQGVRTFPIRFGGISTATRPRWETAAAKQMGITRPTKASHSRTHESKAAALGRGGAP